MFAEGSQSKQDTRQSEFCHQKQRGKKKKNLQKNRTRVCVLYRDLLRKVGGSASLKDHLQLPHLTPENPLPLLFPHASRGPQELLPALQPSSWEGSSEEMPYLRSGLHGCLQNSRLRAARGLRGWRRPCCICLRINHKQQGKKKHYKWLLLAKDSSSFSTSKRESILRKQLCIFKSLLVP